MPPVARAITAVSWGLALAVVIRLALVWDALPDRVATHFTRAGEPDGFMPRAALALLASCAGLVGPLLSTFVRFDRFGHAFLFGTAVTLTSAFWLVIDFNVSGRSVGSAPVILGAGVLAGVAAYVLLGRGGRYR
jgi:hypothetical protein